jgi:hypothetical protein
MPFEQIYQLSQNRRVLAQTTSVEALTAAMRLLLVSGSRREGCKIRYVPAHEVGNS